MSWWPLIVYVVGVMVMFRFQYLSAREKVARSVEQCPVVRHKSGSTKCGYERDHADGSIIVPVIMAFTWPLVVIGWLGWRAMFPRGALSKYERQRIKEQEQKRRQKELDALAEEIVKASRAAGLKVPEGLEIGRI